MVDGTKVARLHRALRQRLGEPLADVLSPRRAEPADYLLANRIPRPLQAVLPPAGSAVRARLLIRAIAPTPGPSPAAATSA